jgi:uncharacterized protein YuzE
MRLEYDQEADALDIVLYDGIAARTEEIDNGTLVDLDGSGRALSIEVLRPARAWPLDEVLSRFDVGDDVAAVLRSLWADDGRYPFEPVETERLAAV